SSSNSSSSGGGWDDSYIMYDVDSRYIPKDELDQLSTWELAALRNEIFARHGRIFTTEEWSSYFAQKSWYTPQYENVDSMLNDYEWKNLEVIMQLEAQRN
ncbi:MAG: YARHG domain-containing protein, partial [Muricoprocola sp.]